MPMSGATWWMDPAHRWMAARQQEAADSMAVSRIGKGTLVLAMSGGKDSNATAIHLSESGLLDAHRAAGGDVRFYFQDVGWELPETYAYLPEVVQAFGPVQHCALWVPGPDDTKPIIPAAKAMGSDTFWVPYWKTPTVMDPEPYELVLKYEQRLGHYSAFLRLIANKASFVPTQQRWCSRTMKTDVAAAYLATLDDPWTAAGIRAEESEPRAATVPWGWSTHHDAWAYSPIKWWTWEMVRDAHLRYGLRPNPIYLQGSGAGRCGCGPCIYSNREDLRWLLMEQKARLDLLADFEQDVAKLPQAQRHARRGAPPPTWFTSTVKEASGQRREQCAPLATILEWAKSKRGGRQLDMFFGHEQAGCVPWNMCEVPRKKVL